ncbi:extracellular calcium-sensing receptor-like [Diadema antillarum]|uniref:extracellular calcium-sensing receptor-like n=1 Tax=Diadema antillarum TaxID=105358 RepID=UPI003A8AF02C
MAHNMGPYVTHYRLLKIANFPPYLALIVWLSLLYLARGENYSTINPLNTTEFLETVTTGVGDGEGSAAAGAVPNSYRKDGDLVLGGLFDMHQSQDGECGDFNPRGLQWMYAMVFAIDQINARRDILPNISLGFDIYDTCADPNIAVRNSVHFIKTQGSSCDGDNDIDDIVAVVGPGTSSSAVSVASLFNLFKLPQVSYAATSDFLSESRYEYFTRTIPEDTYQAQAMAHLVSHFQFETVAVLATDDGAYGVSGIHLFEDKALERNICVAYSKIFDTDDTGLRYEEILNDLRQIPEVRVIVAFANEAPMIDLLTYFAERNVTGYVWIASDGWGSSQVVEDPVISRVTNGMLGLFPHAEVIPAYDEYVFDLTPASLEYKDPFFNEFWENVFNCHVPDGSENVEGLRVCDGTESLNDTYLFTNESLISAVLDSVEVVARALHETLGCSDKDCTEKPAAVTGENLIACMKNVSFQGYSGYRLRPDPSGNLAAIAWYDFYNLQPASPCSNRFTLRQVGEWRNDRGQVEITDDVYWPSRDTCAWSRDSPSSVCGELCPAGTRRVTLDFSSCCWQCVPCPDNYFSNETDALTCLICQDEQVSNENHTDCFDLPYSYATPSSAISIAALTLAVAGWLVCIVIAVIFTLKENTVIIFHAFARSWRLIMVGIMASFITATFSVIPASDVACLGVAATQLLPLSATEGSLIIAAYTTYHRKHVQLNNWTLAMIAVLFVHGLLVLLWILASRPVVAHLVDRTQRIVYIDCVSSGNFDGMVVLIAYALTLDILGIFP